MKSKQRLDYERLADALVDRGLVERGAAKVILEQAAQYGHSFAETLVNDSLVSDWELSRVAADVFGLPFLTVSAYPPGDDVLRDLDRAYLREHGLVPLDRFGNILTVAMPGIVPTEVLCGMGLSDEVTVLPVVGTVQTNRQWLQANLPADGQAAEGQAPQAAATPAPAPEAPAPVPEPAAPVPAAPEPDPVASEMEDFEAVLSHLDNALEEDAWGGIFDAGDEAVQLNLRDTEDEEFPPAL